MEDKAHLMAGLLFIFSLAAGTVTIKYTLVNWIYANERISLLFSLSPLALKNCTGPKIACMYTHSNKQSLKHVCSTKTEMSKAEFSSNYLSQKNNIKYLKYPVPKYCA